MELIQIAEVDCRSEEKQKELAMLLETNYIIQKKYDKKLKILIFAKKENE